jgi:hypothetical protein
VCDFAQVTAYGNDVESAAYKILFGRACGLSLTLRL